MRDIQLPSLQVFKGAHETKQNRNQGTTKAPQRAWRELQAEARIPGSKPQQDPRLLLKLALALASSRVPSTAGPPISKSGPLTGPGSNQLEEKLLFHCGRNEKGLITAWQGKMCENSFPLATKLLESPALSERPNQLSPGFSHSIPLHLLPQNFPSSPLFEVIARV